MGIFGKFSKKQGWLRPPKDDKAKKAAVKEPASSAAQAGEKQADKAPAEPVKRGALAKETAGDSYRVLLSPVLTEKADRQQTLGKYAFIVDIAANKTEVARAVKDLYGVKPVSVRVVPIKGKQVRFGRFLGRRKDLKKAIVTLKSGESITLS